MLLSIQDLKVAFRMGKGVRAEAVKGVSFDIAENTTVALVGESGSGKSVTAMSVLNLLPDNAERSGRILWQGKNLLQTPLAELQKLRGKDIACVFQDPMSSLNPVFSVAQQLCEPLMKHMHLGRSQALKRAEELLGEVGIPEPKRRLQSYPHEMSGGQQQRVMIAMALACEPKLLIADEPTTALDVTIQRQKRTTPSGCWRRYCGGIGWRLEVTRRRLSAQDVCVALRFRLTFATKPTRPINIIAQLPGSGTAATPSVRLLMVGHLKASITGPGACAKTTFSELSAPFETKPTNELGVTLAKIWVTEPWLSLAVTLTVPLNG
jgi:ABC-type dipeptide/oligopeptide/nickel transport system ATPase subunit